MGEDKLESQKQRMQPAKGELSNKREKLKENPTLRRIACEGISGWLADTVGVSSRLELLDSSGWANVLNFVTKGSFVHQITTTRLLATF
jgi:hypothetical protein